MKHLVHLVGGAAAVLLTACGGGGDEPQPAPTTTAAEVPDEASQSSARLVEWVGKLGQIEAEEPLAMGRFAPPTPDDTEPERLS
jgi:hypothetical protein